MKQAEGGWAPEDVRTAAVMVPEGLLDQDGIVRLVFGLRGGMYGNADGQLKGGACVRGLRERSRKLGSCSSSL